MVCGELRRERLPFALRNTAFCLPEITCLWAKTWCFTAVLLCFCRKNKLYCLHRLRVIVRNNHDASGLRLHARERLICVREMKKSECGRCGASSKIKKKEFLKEKVKKWRGENVKKYGVGVFCIVMPTLFCRFGHDCRSGWQYCQSCHAIIVSFAVGTLFAIHLADASQGAW